MARKFHFWKYEKFFSFGARKFHFMKHKNFFREGFSSLGWKGHQGSLYITTFENLSHSVKLTNINLWANFALNIFFLKWWRNLILAAWNIGLVWHIWQKFEVEMWSCLDIFLDKNAGEIFPWIIRFHGW